MPDRYLTYAQAVDIFLPLMEEFMMSLSVLATGPACPLPLRCGHFGLFGGLCESAKIWSHYTAIHRLLWRHVNRMQRAVVSIKAEVTRGAAPRKANKGRAINESAQLAVSTALDQGRVRMKILTCVYDLKIEISYFRIVNLAKNHKKISKTSPKPKNDHLKCLKISLLARKACAFMRTLLRTRPK